MKEIKDFPPNIEKIRERFRLVSNAVFTYGDTLYNPKGGFIDDALWAHEETHSRQQKKIGTEKWWGQYLKDPSFVLSQESEAYLNQYQFAKKTIKNREELSSFARRLAKDLSSSLYGNCVSFSEAYHLITK